jgi:hypothetical protein
LAVSLKDCGFRYAFSHQWGAGIGEREKNEERKIKYRSLLIFITVLLLGVFGSSKAAVEPLLLQDIHPTAGSNPLYLKIVGDHALLRGR